MHPYSSDSREKFRVIGNLAGASVLVSYLIYRYFAPLEAGVPTFLVYMLPLTLFGVFYKVFEKMLWRNRIARKILGVKTPDLNGKWEGVSEDEDQESLLVEIEQTWSKINIELTSKSAATFSHAATLMEDEDDDFYLCFTYSNRDRPRAPEDIEDHIGTAWLEHDDSGGDQTLQGIYINGREERGSIRVDRSM
ncbi:MAG: hypothetical protein ABEK01_04300 [Candidatus Nanohaloarchaea archaeon]